MSEYDIAIIGTGPAGISAAITASIRNKKIVLLGPADLSAKLRKAHSIQNYPGFPGITGEALAGAFQKHLEAMGIQITEKRVSAVYAMGDSFSIQADQDMIEAGSVILATGVVTGKPLPGEEEMLGHGVSYCATCDAPLYRNKTAAVIGYNEREESEAAFLSEICSSILYFPMYDLKTDLPDKIRVVREKPIALEERGGKRIVRTESAEYICDGVFVLRDSVAPAQLVPGLETDGSHVKTTPEMRTNIPGCFVCGDLAGQPYQYVKAAGQGNVAALSAVKYLDQRKRR